MTDDAAIARHYTTGDLATRIMAAARRAVPDLTALTARDLAPVDEFHIGGIGATERFVPMLGLAPGMAVLDVGSGIGGTARYAAETCGCHVTGIDLTPEFCAVATMLSAATGLADRTEFHEGSALVMPFADARFDAAMTLHVAMNIDDKPGLYREIARVLKPGARFGVYDILEGPSPGALEFPVPWAADRATSHLASPRAMRTMLQDAGFTIEHDEDRTGFAIDFFETLRQAAATADGPPPLGLHVIMDETFQHKIANVAANIAAGRCGPWEFVCRRV
jgi:SAM-dependent methyltransferase